MARAQETMRLLRAAAGLPEQAFQTDERLKEIGFGGWEGKTWSEIRQTEAARAKARQADRWGFVPPGGESYAMVAERVGAWLSGLTGDACLVAHGGIARVLLVIRAGQSPENAVQSDIWQGKILLVQGRSAQWRPGPGHH
jgi:probable phosphoglycerate mutase